MPTTPLWVPLAVAILGLAGVLLGQVVAGRREDKRWEREGAREQERWARENNARSYEHRRAAYVAYFTEYNERWDKIAFAQMMPGPENEPPEDYLNTLYDLASNVEILGSREAARCAREAYQVLADWAYRRKEMPADALDAFREHVRSDLDIPD